MAQNENRGSGKEKNQKQNVQATSRDFEQLRKEAEKEETRKPGSQSNSSKQHNNGRGGGK